ncbi:MAG TPA: HAMP domain-containing sensor histidine kinase [Streptosporangiaceae bacterium]|nr:HAMP domain-containing sensor histidine kinase [Streptosporangiaceae bacterium]
MTSPAAGHGHRARRVGGLRRWLAGRTLRGRLIAGLLALLFVACAAVGVVTYLALRGFLLGQLDDQLTAASVLYEGCVNGPPGPANNDHPPQGGQGMSPEYNPAGCANTPGQAQGTFSAALNSGNVVTTAKITHGTCHLSAVDDATLARLPANGHAYTAMIYSLHADYRLMAVRDGNIILISGLPVSSMNTTLHDVELTEVIVFSAALLLTGVIGMGWVRLSLRPLRRVSATAAEVTGLPLASGAVDLPHRVPDADPRTEVGQLGTAFNRMLGHVESALARRHASEARLRTFAADASHELRTPLAAIRGYAELARRHSGTLPPEVEHALARVESESARMSALVEDLLLLARLDAGRPLESAPVDLTRLAIDATSDARVAGADHRWQLDLPHGPLLVRGDEQRLHQVLANLLSNARTHTPPGTTVTVALGPVAGRPGAELSVTDDGPGIPAELQADVFDRFVRGDSSRSREAGSTGLGLAIVAAVIAAHHGTVTVSSRPGHTRFLITLPLLHVPA